MRASAEHMRGLAEFWRWECGWREVTAEDMEAPSRASATAVSGLDDAFSSELVLCGSAMWNGER